MERDGERIEITISSRFENIELVQVIAEHLCENAGLDEDGSHWIGMAVREAVANAIKHGNKLDVRKKVSATFDLRGPELEIRIKDEGEGFDPELCWAPLPGYWPFSPARSSWTVKTDARPVTSRILRTGARGAASARSPPRSQAWRCAASSTFIPVESQNSTPDISTTTRAGSADRIAASNSLCSRGAV